MDIARPAVVPVGVTNQGAGVIFGLVSSGWDDTNEDFKVAGAAGNTRVQYCFDTGWPGSPPPGYNYGTEYSKAQLDAAAPGGLSGLTDSDGVATHLAGCAAAGGYSTGQGQPTGVFKGIAPLCDLLVAKVPVGYPDARYKEAVQWVFGRADALNKPCVCLIDYAALPGSFDGYVQLDRDIAALTRAGRLAVAPVGDNAQKSVHKQVIGSGGAVNVVFNIAAYTTSTTSPEYVTVECWHDDWAGPFSVRLITPSGSAGSSVGPGQNLTYATATEGQVEIRNDLDTNGSEATARLAKLIKVSVFRNVTTSPHPAAGNWTIELTGTGRIDCRIAKWFFTSNAGATFSAPDGIGELGSPSSSYGVIGAGGYVSRTSYINGQGVSQPTGYVTGDLNKRLPSSSRGFRRDGYTRPDVIGPGTVVASLSKDFATSNNLKSQDRRHFHRQGSNVGAALTAGVLVLALENEPTLDPSTAAARLALWAAGSVPTEGEGWGLLKAGNAP